MKKLKLDVVRFENEDVIATSTCAHLNTMVHIKILEHNVDGNGDRYAYYLASNSGLELIGTYTNRDFDDEGITSTGWYYITAPEADPIRCSDQSDAAHPVAH